MLQRNRTYSSLQYHNSMRIRIRASRTQLLHVRVCYCLAHRRTRTKRAHKHIEILPSQQHFSNRSIVRATARGCHNSICLRTHVRACARMRRVFLTTMRRRGDHGPRASLHKTHSAIALCSPLPCRSFFSSLYTSYYCHVSHVLYEYVE